MNTEEVLQEKVAYKKYSEVEEMLRIAPELHATPYGVDSLLSRAVTDGNKQFVQFWIDNKFDVNITVPGLQRNALAKAISKGQYEIAELLLKAGINPNCEMNRPLITAITSREADCLHYLRLLHRFGADFEQNFPNSVTNEESLSLLDWAQRFQRQEAVQFIRSVIETSDSGFVLPDKKDYGLGRQVSNMGGYAGNVPYSALSFLADNTHSWATCGLSSVSHKVDPTISKCARFELYVQSIQDDSVKLENRAGDLLESVAQALISVNEWRGHPLTFLSLATAVGSWGNGEDVCHIMLFSDKFICSDSIALVRIVPVYKSELLYHNDFGAPSFMSKLEEKNVPNFLSFDREAAA